MAVTVSPRLGITRWSAGTDPFTRAQTDADHAALDLQVAIHKAGVFGALPAPAAANNGMYYLATDTGDLYRSNGAAWTQVLLTGDVVETFAWTYAFPGDVKVTGTSASGEVNSIPRIPVKVPAGLSLSIIGHEWTLDAGTSFTYSIEHFTGATHGTVATLVSGVVAASATKRDGGTFTPKVCADRDAWRPKVTGISSTPNAGAVSVVAVLTV